jgi:hypothetical protein
VVLCRSAAAEKGEHPKMPKQKHTKVATTQYNMKIWNSKWNNVIAALFLSLCALNVTAQTTVPKGKAQLIEFTNATAKFTVPEGKTWIIYSIFSDYVTGGQVKLNDYTKKNELEEEDDIRIFIKDLNGVPKTDYLKNIYGTQLYRSTNASTVIPYPIIFPEKTTVTLIVLKGNLGSLKEYDGKAYISLIEIDN